MNIETKYNIGDRIYFYDVAEGKIMRGEIDWISIVVSKSERLNGIKYHIKRITFDANKYPMEEVGTFACHEALEHQVFKDRSDALDFAIKITEDIK